MEIEKREALESRVNEVEVKVNSLSNLRHLDNFRSVSDRLIEVGLQDLSEYEIWVWCEKIRSDRGSEKVPCPSGEPIKNLYPLAIVDEAITFYQKIISARHRN